MKIPGSQAPGVAPGPTRAPALAVPAPTGFGAITQGAGGLDQAGAQAAQLYEKYQHQNRVKAVNDATTQYQRAITDANYGETVPDPSTSPGAPVADVSAMSEGEFSSFLEGPTPKRTEGFLSIRGDHALKALDPTLSNLEKRRQEIAKGIEDPQARELFLQQSENLRTSNERSSQAHVAAELERGKEDSIKAATAQLKRDVSADPMKDHTELIAGVAGRAAALARNKETADAYVEAIQAEAATARIEVLLRQEKYDAAEMVLKGSEHALGMQAEVFKDAIEKGRAAGEVATIGARIIDEALPKSEVVTTEEGMDLSGATRRHIPGRSDVDLQKVREGLSKVTGSSEKRRRVADVVDDMLARDARAMKEERDAFIDAAGTQYTRERGKFFATETAELLREVDYKEYLRLEDRFKLTNRLARSEGRERDAFQKQYDDMAMEDLRRQMADGDPNDVDMQGFLEGYDRMSAPKVMEAQRRLAEAKKVHSKGLRPSQDQFVARFMADVSSKMPEFEGTPKEVRDASTAWKQEQRDTAINLYSDLMGPEGEPPDKKKLDDAKAKYILGLPVTTESLKKGTDVKAVTRIGAPPPEREKQEAITPVGIIEMQNGDRYQEFSDGSTRLLSKGKRK